MANEEHVALVKQGSSAWNAWRLANPDLTPNLHKANLRGTDLSGANLSKAYLVSVDLREANLSEADLMDADLSLGNLSETVLTKAHLTGAILSRADLSRADLSGAILNEAILSGANLNEANFSRVLFSLTVFADNDLSTAKGLETVSCFGPSTLGIDTLFKSKGEIPEVFLRGVGVPEGLIIQIPSLVASIQPIQFHSCFISYSHKDEQFSQRLHRRMLDEKLRVWFAPEDMRGGRKLHEEVFSAIQIHDKLLLVLSESSMRSEWVMTEIRRARKVEQEESRRKLFPIRLVDFDAIQKWECFDADGGKDLAVELREYYVPDFSNWKDHDSFEKEFAKLLRDLRSS